MTTREALFVKTRVILGIANRRKYDMCSANGWMTAAHKDNIIVIR
jgi:hypothetical protein